MSKNNLAAELFQSLMEDHKEPGKVIPLQEQRETLAAFLAHQHNPSAFKVGDFVEPNAFGKQRYNIVKNCIAVIASVFDKPMLDDNGTVVHGDVAMAAHGHVETHSVDFRYFRKVES